MLKFKYGLLLFALGSVQIVKAESCPDYDSLAQLPHFELPEQVNFSHSSNIWLSGIYSPYHVVHDQIILANETVTIMAKFDYSRWFHKDLEDEKVHAYIYGSGMTQWQYLGAYITDSDGKIFVPVQKPEGEYQLRMVVEGDLSSVNGYLSVVSVNRKAVLFDIDGTLTLNDFESVGDYLGVDKADPHYYAKETVTAYKNKGYQIIYLTGRPYWIAKDSREWFDYMGLPQGQLHTDPYGDGPIPENTQAYKTQYLNKLIQDKSIDFVRAYGNATTDIAAYADAGISVDETYIIGENAGMDGTQPIYGDYSYHYSDKVANFAELNCD